LFIIKHDCGHGSYFSQRWANDWVGRVLGVLTMTPYDYWRRAHAVHHATSGNLDRRGVGDVPTLTIEEYYALSPLRRFGYRFVRHPIVIFAVAPVYLFVFQYRLPSDLPIFSTGLWRGVMATNVAILVLFGGLAAIVGPVTFALVHGPVVLVGATIGLWMFFVQHQYEGVYWEREAKWDFAEAALYGSSYYHLPAPLQWMTAHIGLHHVHHLSSKIPNYRLQECLEHHPVLRDVPSMTLLGSLKCVRLKLWDEQAQALITFDEAARRHASPA
jgi:omega-6 fatty acid desaturase (delta-12 desaturase)